MLVSVAKFFKEPFPFQDVGKYPLPETLELIYESFDKK